MCVNMLGLDIESSLGLDIESVSTRVRLPIRLLIPGSDRIFGSVQKFGFFWAVAGSVWFSRKFWRNITLKFRSRILTSAISHFRFHGFFRLENVPEISANSRHIPPET
eukprot:sb/3477555/